MRKRNCSGTCSSLHATSDSSPSPGFTHLSSRRTIPPPDRLSGKWLSIACTCTLMGLRTIPTSLKLGAKWRRRVSIVCGKVNAEVRELVEELKGRLDQEQEEREVEAAIYSSRLYEIENELTDGCALASGRPSSLCVVGRMIFLSGGCHGAWLQVVVA